jgi:hypothetical protein
MPSTPVVTVSNGWPSLNVGALRHSITVQIQGLGSPITYDAAGPKLAWNPFTTAMASVVPVRGTDVIKAGQVTTQLFVTVTMWWQPGILPNMQVLNDNGSTYVIQSVENILEMDVVLVLNCLGLAANV